MGGAALWWRAHPSACPYGQRVWVQAPHPFITRKWLANLQARQADATRLPHDDATFDAAVLVAVLGEIPDQDAALRELAWVLKPGGRLVVGELAGDPHMVRAGALRERGERAGLRFDRRVGPPFGYFGVLVKPAGQHH